MVSLDNLEYSYHDSNMAEIGITPAEVELTIPSFVISDRAEQIAYWEHQMNLASAKLQQASGDVRIYDISNHKTIEYSMKVLSICMYGL